jgi:hypothetical protein
LVPQTDPARFHSPSIATRDGTRNPHSMSTKMVNRDQSGLTLAAGTAFFCDSPVTISVRQSLTERVTTTRNTHATRTYAAYHRAYRSSPEYQAKVEARRDLQRLAKAAQRGRRQSA